MRFSLIVFLCFLGTSVLAQQVADPNFSFEIKTPKYKGSSGSTIAIDEAHNNFHRLEGRYAAFANLLSQDGYVLKSNTRTFSLETLNDCDILVIANALHESNLGRWILPNPSAFTIDEIIAVKDWVSTGGRLFLIADHMPFAGAAADLAKALGFEFHNGFAMKEERGFPDIFTKRGDMLMDLDITAGIDSINTFTGQGFEIPEAAKGLLKFDERFVSYMPDTAWRFNANTNQISLENLWQGAIMSYGKGRLAVFGEAAMFTTQLAGPEEIKVGMNTEGAHNNPQFLLNIIHWLDD